MRESAGWSLGLGRWGGIEVRLHVSLVVGLIFGVYFCGQAAPSDALAVSVLAGSLFLASVAFHELAHALATVRLDGRVERIMLAPLGCFGPVQLAREPHRELMVALAGPAANFTLMMLSAVALVAVGADLQELLLSPFDPRNLVAGEAWLVALKLGCWINWLLLLNLFPAFPLDGGRALHAVLSPALGARQAVIVVACSAMLAAVGLLLMAWWLPDEGRVIPAWLPLSLFAVFLFFAAHLELEALHAPEPEEDLLGYDFSQGYTSLNRSFEERRKNEPSLFSRWLARRREARRERRLRLEAEEEIRVDDVLMRLKEYGMQGLSGDERALLHRVSRRYRNRLQSD